jgi:plastocyanin
LDELTSLCCKSINDTNIKKRYFYVRGCNAMNSKRLKILVLFLAILAFGSILLAACSRPGTITNTPGTTPTASGSGGGGGAGGCASGTVHMSASNFKQPCVNVTKGSKVTLVDDVQVLHIITNGQWVNDTPQLAVQPGAPTINNVNISGGSADIGPFNTAGKFNVLCTVHVGMNLVVNVT